MLDVDALFGSVITALKAPLTFLDSHGADVIHQFSSHLHERHAVHSHFASFAFVHPKGYSPSPKSSTHALSLVGIQRFRRSKMSEAVAFYGAEGPTEPLIAFQKAEASDEYNPLNFGAKAALYPGSGYWCSSGRHDEDEVVSWTGRLASRRKVRGIKINWAYTPGEFKILTSPDGANFEETKCWTPKTSDQVSYEQDIMFEGLRNVKAVQIQMRGPQEWKYFGINDAVLVAGPAEPIMLVNGMKADMDNQEVRSEFCLVTKPDSDEGALGLVPCASAMQANDGRAIFKFNEEGQFMHLATKTCLAGGSSPGGGNVSLADCAEAMQEGDGRSIWAVSGDGQFKLARSENECLVHTLEKKDGKKVRKILLQPCDEAGQSNDAQDKWFMVSAKTDFEGAPSPAEHEFLFGHKPPPIPGLEEA
eukprot:gnl/MRDRNA2_/MRDRNA2_76813_c0_seq1.p1 gnl/MRDRNA2_/MRDRNA2_76813_c0~~gnl/MRDRNA2_/MRDRNA2_76813_c0_seq1.p1  ORF type:complete len:419 (+),score=92.09 gnl/MRDRNA2_/MRDRNA2_76813_c0_seq1:103-1359(+)